MKPHSFWARAKRAWERGREKPLPFGLDAPKAAAMLSAVALVGGFGITATGLAMADGASAQPSGTVGAPIESPANAPRDKHSISGLVWKEFGGATIHYGLGLPYHDNKIEGDEALPGVKIYARWMDEDGTVSPVYTTTSVETGTSNNPGWNWAITMQSFYDGQGKLHEFDAKLGAVKGEKIQVWADNPDPENLDLYWQYGYGQMWPKSIADTTGGVDTDLVKKSVQNVAIAYAAKQDDLSMHLDKEQWLRSEHKASAGGGFVPGTVQGKVIWNWVQNPGALNAGFLASHDPGDEVANGLTVVGSYLSDYAVEKIYKDYCGYSGFGGLARCKNSDKHYIPAIPRMLGWNAKAEKELQAWIKQQIQTEGKDKWIAETVVDTVHGKSASTGAFDHFVLNFKGTYGNPMQMPGIPLNQASCPAFMGEKCHTVAEKRSDGNWAQSNLNSKHINPEWMQVSVLGLNDETSILNPWHFGGFTGYSVFTAGDIANAAYAPSGANLIPADTVTFNSGGWQIALAPGKIALDVLEYDTISHFAGHGDKVTAHVTGAGFDQKTTYVIKWMTQDGTYLEDQACTNLKANQAGRIPDCVMTVPDSIRQSTIVTAELYSVNSKGEESWLDSDTYLVMLGQDGWGTVGQPFPAASPANPVNDGDTYVGADFPKQIGGHDVTYNVTLAEGSELPAGLSMDPTTGAITGTPEAAGTYRVRIKGTTSAPDPNVADTTQAITYERQITITITDTELKPANATEEKAYTGQISVTGPETANANYSAFTLADSVDSKVKEQLDGLAIDADTGKITFTAKPGAATQHAGADNLEAGQYVIPFTYTVTEADETVHTFTDTVMVHVVGEDSVKPVIQAPKNVDLEAGQPVNVTTNPTVSDNVTTDITIPSDAFENLPDGITWNEDKQAFEGTAPKSPINEPITVTIVGSKVHDDAGNTAEDTTFTITLKDTTKPEITADDFTADQTDVGTPVEVNVPVSATDGVDGAITLTPENFSGLPDGLTWDGSKITGTLPKPGTHRVTVTVTDTAGNKATKTITITVADKAPLTVEGATVTVKQSEQLAKGQTAFTANKDVTLVKTDLAEKVPGLEMAVSGKTATITGYTEAEPGEYTVTTTVRDAAGNVQSVETKVVVSANAVPTFADSGLTDGKIVGTVGTPIEPVTITATGDHDVTLEVSQPLPDGIKAEVKGNKVVFTGAPAKAGNGTITVRATDTTTHATVAKTIPYEFTDPTPTTTPKVTTDKDNYAPGDTVKVTVTDPVDGTDYVVQVTDGSGNPITNPVDVTNGNADIVIPDTTKDGDYKVVLKEKGKDGVVTDKPITVATDTTDTDKDGLTDKTENTDCYDPTVVDGTGKIDCPEKESDQHKTDPNNPDTDGDGVSDGQEIKDNTNPLNPDSFKDTDGDGVPDVVEKAEGTDPNDPNSYKDTDGDEVPDYVEKKDGTDPEDPTSFKDTDGDGVPDYVETVKDKTDPKDPDSFKDTDGDGLPDYVERHTCYDKTITDSTGKLDRCPEGWEKDPNIGKTDPNNPDTDGDGVSDGQEIKDNTNPLNPDSFKDTDGDGVPDVKDKCADTPKGTTVDVDGCPVDPGTDKPTPVVPAPPKDKDENKDTDGDGLSDKHEDTTCYDPTVVDGTGELEKCPEWPDDQHKTDKNSADTDGDGVSDGQEIKDGTNPLNPDSYKRTATALPTKPSISHKQPLSKTGVASQTLLLVSLGLAAAGSVLVLRRRKNS